MTSTYSNSDNPLTSALSDRKDEIVMQNRVCCLYRVSTDKQVDYDDKHNADIPMQRKECHKFAQAHGWTIVMEEQEEGVSGHKVRAADRDKLQLIKEAAAQKKFDILLVFMFDRIGRIADETPFVVEWFVKNGIRVWSTQEGEQRFESHADKLMNYIRFWQADGESEKTSIRTRTRLGQVVEEGHFKGGVAPYGYRLVKGERLSKKKHELYELEIVEEEAAVVRRIFEKYAYEGYGAQRIATFLNDGGYPTRSGKPWHHATIRGIVCNLTYTGVLRSGESRSQVLPHLQIISQELFDAAQEVRLSRAGNNEATFAPRNTRGQSLLVGNIFCAHCGSRLNVTTNVKNTASGKEVVRLRYVCYGRKHKQVECNGQTGYDMLKIDGALENLVRQIFQRMQGVPRKEIVQGRYQQKLAELKALAQAAQTEHIKAEKDLNTLKAEVIKAIRGESAFSQELLADMIQQAEEKYLQLRGHWEAAENAYQQSSITLKELEKQYDAIISMAEMYDGASLEAKKMIVSRIIQRVDVAKGYQLKVTLYPEFRAFFQQAESWDGQVA